MAKKLEAKRELLETLKSLIFELVEIDHDVARLELVNSRESVKRAKRVLLLHERNTNRFRKAIDDIRKEMIKENPALANADKDENELNDSDVKP